MSYFIRQLWNMQPSIVRMREEPIMIGLMNRALKFYLNNSRQLDCLLIPEGNRGSAMWTNYTGFGAAVADLGIEFRFTVICCRAMKRIAVGADNKSFVHSYLEKSHDAEFIISENSFQVVIDFRGAENVTDDRLFSKINELISMGLKPCMSRPFPEKILMITISEHDAESLKHLFKWLFDNWNGIQL